MKPNLDEFDIKDAKNPREQRRKIVEHLDQFRDILNYILNPDSNSIIDLYEYKSFEDKNHIFLLFKELMVINRRSIICDLKNDEQEDIKFIEETCEKWEKIKKELISIIEHLEQVWINDKEYKHEVRYFG